MSGIYLHIPFCDTKCIYCDFYSITNHSTKERFIESLIKEIKDKSSQLSNKNFDTVFFGGGTPSLLKYDDFNLIFDVLYSAFNISDKSEITIEANPGTLNKEKLTQLKKLPINRISFGVQSFIDSELKFLTRIHTSEEATKAIKSAQDAGFENINLDLIFALPEQCLENWKYNLETAVSLNTPHISAYSLIFEENTYLHTMLNVNKVKQADEELEGEMYNHTISYLSANNINQYEISNFAKEGFESRHNLKYWTHQEYIGYGPSAASFIDNYRWINVRDINKYIELIESGEKTYDFIEHIDRQTSIDEYIFLGLRSKGIDIGEFKSRFNFDFIERYCKAIALLVEKGYADLTKNFLKLTPNGYAVCDEIVVRYF